MQTNHEALHKKLDQSAKVDQSAPRWIRARQVGPERQSGSERVRLDQSANGAEYDSQGQARSEAERVAPGYDQHEGYEA